MLRSAGRSIIITQGDLQHYRWVLNRINGESLDVDAMNGSLHDLDFGEQMHVFGNTDCNRITGRISLHDEYIRFGQLISTLMYCSPAQNVDERTILSVIASTAIEVTINGNYLNLQAGEVSLRYQFAGLG